MALVTFATEDARPGNAGEELQVFTDRMDAFGFNVWIRVNGVVVGSLWVHPDAEEPGVITFTLGADEEDGVESWEPQNDLKVRPRGVAPVGPVL